MSLPKIEDVKDTINENEQEIRTKTLGPTQPQKRDNAIPSHCIESPTNKASRFCYPKLIIGGAMKCGTNEAMQLISHHPRTKFNLCPREIRKDKSLCTSDKYQGVALSSSSSETANQNSTVEELALWESHPSWLCHEDTIQDYLDRFPITDGINTINIDKSPQYLDTYLKPELPKVTRSLLPGSKMVFTLCDPAERMASEFHHYQKKSSSRESFGDRFVRRGIPPPTNFTEFIDIILNEHSEHCIGNDEKKVYCEELKINYLTKGEYIKGINDWKSFYDPQDILILDMNADPTETTKKLLEFAELPFDEYPWGVEKGSVSYHNEKVKGYSGREQIWSQYPKEMKMLASFYTNSNKELSKQLSLDFPLKWKSTKY